MSASTGASPDPGGSTAALTKQATLPCTRDRAFALFTREMSAWWPLATHSVGGDPAGRVEMPGRVGGRIVETLPDGTSATWGTVTGWQPPARVAFTWHPGGDAAAATTVEVTFEECAAGAGTVVTLVHRDWPARTDGATARQQYDAGWELVLGRYVEAVEGLSPVR